MNGLFRFPRTAWRWPALALALLLAAPQALAAQLLDRIVAVVNDDVVLLSELEQEVKTVAAQLQQRNIPLPDQQILIRQVLERLIMQRLQLAVAERSGIRVDEATLNAAVQRIAEQNNLSLSQFRAALEAEGYDYAAFREGLRNEIVLARLHQRQAESRVHITPQEIDEFLASQSGSNTDEYLVGHILISIPDQASAAQLQQARERAEQVLRALREGAELAQLAASYSDSPTALDGGSLGWRTQGELPTLFANVVPQLAVGETADILQGPSGFHIIQLLDRRSSDRAVITQTRARHILITPDEVVSGSDPRQLL